MKILYFLIGCSVLLASIFVGAFFWANKNGQHDDMHSPGMRILFEEEPLPENKEETPEKPANEDTC